MDYCNSVEQLGELRQSRIKWVGLPMRGVSHGIVHFGPAN